MVAELAAIGVVVVVALTELLHSRRIQRLARLAFGPDQHSAVWATTSPFLRMAAVGAVTWGLVTLLTIKPKSHAAETLPDNQRRHLLVVLDVSPSMRLKDIP